MTETAQIPQALINSIATPTLNINREHAAIHLAILGDRTNYIVTAKNHNTNKVRNKALTKAEILTFAEDMNNQGFCVWISLNPKEDDGNIYVTALADFWLDIDARPKGIDDRAATQQEIDEAYDRAIKLKEYIEKTYGAVGFIAFSGNGYHLHFPLPHTEFTPEQRVPIGTSETDTVTNAKVRNFAKQTATNIGKTIDNTYDINRKTALIGSFNLKILNQPIPTNWLEDFLPETLDGTLKSVDYARNQNQKLLEAILNTPIEQQQPTTYRDTTHEHAKLDIILKQDQKLNDLYNGNWKQYGYPTRSEAEAAVLTILFGRYGFSTDEAREAMKNCKIGKWQEQPGSYRETTLQNALKWIIEHPTETEYEEDTKPRESQADRLYKLFIAGNSELFHDQNGTEFARIPLDANNAYNAINASHTSYTAVKYSERENREDTAIKVVENTVNCVYAYTSKEIVRLKDEKFKTYLAHLLYSTEQKVLNTESVSQVIRLLKYDALHGKCYKLFNRVAPDPSGDGSIWLDCADAQNRAYHITKNGWVLETNIPILFRRFEHQKPLVEAIHNGNPKLLLPFVNIGANKNSDLTKHRQLLLLVQTASYLIPDIAHPINAMFGCPASHKSTAQRFIREIFDPSAAPLLRVPRDENAALQVFDHHYIPIFDQIFFMPQWFSDMLCSAVTGAGQESRALYTDDDSFIRSFRRCVMLNGLNLPATKGDLLSRTIMHPTEPNVERRTDQDLDATYIKILPEILGGFLDVIVTALNLKDTIKPTKLFRLADFTEWGVLLAVALGEKDTDFIAAMEENLNSQNTADIENNIVADAFLAYCKGSLLSTTEEKPMADTPDYIFSMVTATALQLNMNTKSKRWPSAACYFTRKLNDSKNAIIASGWNYDIFHDGKGRKMTIWSTKAVEIFHFQRLGPNDNHCCDFCKGLLADFEQVLDAETKKELGKEALYFCKSCFDKARVRAEADGYRFTIDEPEN